MMIPETFSAQVVLAPLAPSGAVDELRRSLLAMGIEVGPTIGGNFSVTATRPKMEALFGVDIAVGPNGAYEVVLPGGQGLRSDSEIPLDNLSDEWRRVVSAVVFTRRPDFGP